MIGICKPQSELMLPWQQLELPLRLCFAVVLVRAIEGDGLALVHKGFGIIDDQVVMAAALLVPGGSRQELKPLDFELVCKFGRYSVTIFDVGK